MDVFVRAASVALSTIGNDIVKGQEISALVLPPEYQVGAIRVTSNPSGATVILDDFVGPQITTPHTFEKVPAGYSEIELALDGYLDWSTNLQVRIESGAINTGIHENCFIDNEPQAWDDGTDNNWIGNYWSPPPGGPSNYIIPGAAGSEDKDPLDECPMSQHE